MALPAQTRARCPRGARSAPSSVSGRRVDVRDLARPDRGRRLGRRAAAAQGAGGDRARGCRTASAASWNAARSRSSAPKPGSPSTSGERAPTATATAPDRARRRVPTAGRSIPGTASSSSSSAHGNRLAHARCAGGGRTARPGLQPAVSVRAARVSARPTCCTRSATTCSRSAAARRFATRPPSRSRTTSSRRSAPGRFERFKHAYRDADVLLIDDVQFLASKAKTEEEFFHTFNALYETGRQLVLTCDRLPRSLVDDRGAAAGAVRSRPRRRDRAAGPRDARRDPAQAGRARRHVRRRRRPCSS